MYVEQEIIEKVTKYVQVPQEQVVRVTKIEYRDTPQIIENLVEVPEITYQDRIIWVDSNTCHDKTVEVPGVKQIEEYVAVPVVKKVEKRIAVPKVEYVDKVIEVPVIKVVQIFVDVVTEEQTIKYVDVEIEDVQEEIVEVVTVKRVEKPEIVYVDKEIIVPKIVKVEKLVTIDREVHHAVHEETREDVDLGTETTEDVVVDTVLMKGGTLKPEIMQAVHEWDRTKMPAQYQSFTLPQLTADGRINEAKFVPPIATPAPAPAPAPASVMQAYNHPSPVQVGHYASAHPQVQQHPHYLNGRPENLYGGRFVGGKNSVYF